MATKDKGEGSEKLWAVKGVPDRVKKQVKLFAVEHDLTMAQAVETLVELALHSLKLPPIVRAAHDEEEAAGSDPTLPPTPAAQTLVDDAETGEGLNQQTSLRGRGAMKLIMRAMEPSGEKATDDSFLDRAEKLLTVIIMHPEAMAAEERPEGRQAVEALVQARDMMRAMQSRRELPSASSGA